ncbi:tol [Fusarium tjaetaba]|uniref:Tol n=1 Tax=Fusarium tjaetaba TaxID=1567544 RepID=A0A8H5VG93_9HYPO|nr:tol [Fusarium tjaetaba]KAF5622381.1 tol [Fusarium tjaetaba]
MGKASPDHGDQGCTYDELVQAAEADCPRCTFVLKCIRGGATHLKVGDIKKVTTPSRGYVKFEWSAGEIMLEIFNQNGKSIISLCFCQSQIHDSSASFICPKRLLDLSNGTLVLREHLRQKLRYACLSHCWGKIKIVKTTTQTIAGFKTEVPLDQLSKTFRDAVDICRSLGIIYLWIDSLCIIQDSPEDWKEQAAQMADVYQHSFLTIAATKSHDGSQGCFSETSHQYVAKLVPGYKDIYVRQQVPLFPNHWVQLDKNNNYPVLNRAWIYQEMMLSPRVLHFCNEEVIWVCRSSQRSESGCNDRDYNDDKSFKPTLFSCVNDIPRDSDQFTWHRSVQEYSRLNLTYESDKTIALAGVAQRMQRTRPDDRYLAGIWEKHLPLDLLWMVWPTPKIKKPRLARYPSWSWASVSSQVMWDGNWSPLQSVVIQKVRYTPDGPSHMGNCSRSSIILQAPLIDVKSLLPTKITPMGVWNDNVSHTVTPVEDISVEELCVNDYKPDSPSDGSASTTWPPAIGGFVIPLGVNVEDSYNFCGIHVIKKLGSNCYERVGHVGISHDALQMSNYTKFFHRLKHDDASRKLSMESLETTSRSYAYRVRELLEGLQVSEIVLV